MSEKKVKQDRKNQPQQKQIGRLVATFFVDDKGRSSLQLTGFPANNMERAQLWLHHINRVVAQYYVKQAKGEVEEVEEVEPSRILTPQNSGLTG